MAPEIDVFVIKFVTLCAKLLGYGNAYLLDFLETLNQQLENNLHIGNIRPMQRLNV